MAVKKKTTAKKAKPEPKAKAAKAPKAKKPKAAAKTKAKVTAKVSSVADDLRAKSGDELGDRLVKLQKEQFNLRFQRANGQLEKTSRVRVVRREIARIHTILNEQRRRAAEG
jgi:large subunit ribosomal protein L29